jgi:hypothetical protein
VRSRTGLVVLVTFVLVAVFAAGCTSGKSNNNSASQAATATTAQSGNTAVAPGT